MGASALGGLSPISTTLFPAIRLRRTSSKGAQNSLVAAIEFHTPRRIYEECQEDNDPLLPFFDKRITNRNPYKKRKTIDKEVIAALTSIPEKIGIGELYLTSDDNKNNPRLPLFLVKGGSC
jgi:hypothetical protein